MVARLLLIGCSQRKRGDSGFLPAIERYDGPAFRVLRRYLKQSLNFSVDIQIFSAEYGLIDLNYALPDYNIRMSKERGQALHSQVLNKLDSIVHTKDYKRLLICMGKDYIDALNGYESLLPGNLVVEVAKGGIGRKLSILHDWLYESSPSHSEIIKPTTSPKTVKLRGIEVNLTSEQVLDIARQAIAMQDRRASNYQSWYVLVDDQRIAPKWLVSQITGLPVSNFVTDDARRVLTQIGVEVKRI